MYSTVIHVTRYARWNEVEQRRETYPETVDRYVDHFVNHLQARHDYKVPKKLDTAVRAAINNLDVMPSMRAFMTAGPALTSAEVANFNCAYLAVDTIRAFSEHLYVLMCGAGSGFSVERKATDKLPEVPAILHPTDTVIAVADSRKGWCVALNQLLILLYAGSVPRWDVSRLRPEGARLKTFGGFSSGPKPLVELFEYCVKMFKNAPGRKLKPIEVFGIMTMIAQITVVGGVRRSATIALFDQNDAEMRRAKSRDWHTANPHYAMANISAVFESKPDALEFLDVWRDLIASYAGEPGIFNRQAVWKDAEAIGRNIRTAT
jgi:ribonucleoside-triphosphate reductase (thioredoxin)